MERKLGEIFEFKGEYYQVFLDEKPSCKDCVFFQEGICTRKNEDRDIVGSCAYDLRTDKNSIHFKKVLSSSTYTSTNFSNKKKLLLFI